MNTGREYFNFRITHALSRMNKIPQARHICRGECFYQHVYVVPSEWARGNLCASAGPGVVQTEFHEQVGIDPNRYPVTIVMKPEDVVQASLMGLKLGEVICVPAMEDPSLLTQIQENERRFFELTRSGNIADRYKS